MFRRATIQVLIVLLVLALSGCGGGKHQKPVVSTSHKIAPAEINLSDVLTQLDTLKVPDSLNQTVFSQLKTALRAELLARWENKIVCIPPIGNANAVSDLTLSVEGSGLFTLSWHYRNIADYNQDGTVSIPDLTPLAVHFGKAVPQDEEYCIEEVVDGGGNALIDVSDVTPIAIHFGTTCLDYEVQGAFSPIGPFEPVALVPQANGSGEGRLGYSAQYLGAGYDYFRVVPRDETGAYGEPSNVVKITGELAPFSPWPMVGHDSTQSNTSAAIGPPAPEIALRVPSTLSHSDKVIRPDGNICFVSRSVYNDTVAAKSPDGMLLWSRDISGHTGGLLVGTDSSVYYSSTSDDKLHALDSNGNESWSVAMEVNSGSYPLMGPDALIYVPTTDQGIVAVNQSGAVVRRIRTDLVMSPYFAIGRDSTFYVGAYDEASDTNFLYALKKNGLTKWVLELESALKAPPIVTAEGNIYAMYKRESSHIIIAVTPQGDVQWEYDTEYFNEPGLALSKDGGVYVNLLTHMTALTPMGRVEWDFAPKEATGTKPALVDGAGTVYVPNGDCLQSLFSDGEPKWLLSAGEGVSISQPIMDADGTIYASLRTIGVDVAYEFAVIKEGSGEPPAIQGVYPQKYLSGETTQIEANITGVGRFTYQWDFGGGATPNTSAEVRPQIMFGEPGTYAGTLTVNGPYGSDTFNFDLMPTEQPAWPTFQHDAQHTGRSPAVGPELPEIHWSLPESVFLTNTPIIGGNELYLGSTDTRLVAVDFAGNETWSWQYGHEFLSNNAAVAGDGTIYMTADVITVLRYPCEVLWITAQVIDNETIVLGSDGNIYLGGSSYTPEGQHVLHVSIPSGNPVGAPALSPDLSSMYVSLRAPGGIQAISTAGDNLWRYDAGNRVYYCPAVSDDGTIYIASGYFDNENYVLYAINSDGSEKWRLDIPAFPNPPVAIREDGSLLMLCAHSLLSVNPQGEVEWEREQETSTSNNPPIVDSDGSVYFGNGYGNIKSYDSDGGLKWDFHVGAQPLSGLAMNLDGTIFVVDKDGVLYAIGEAGA